jgi:hypothetical protein
MAVEIERRFSRRSLALVLLFLALLLFGVVAAFYWLLQSMPGTLALKPSAGEDPGLVLARIEAFLAHLRQMEMLFIPVAAGTFALAALGLWGSLRVSLKGLLRPQPRASQPPVGRSPAAPAAAPPTAHPERLLLHLLSVMQREGRLIDFLCEDLSAYADAQIGAAVRGIHENCQRVLRRTLNPAPIIEAQEGSRFTVHGDLDPAAVKLTGNVGGSPPFEGIVRHRGWRAATLDLPALAPQPDERLIAPAEIEIP